MNHAAAVSAQNSRRNGSHAVLCRGIVRSKRRSLRHHLDPSKLAVQNAQVTVENAATSATRAVASNQQGLYSIPAVPLGRYNTTIEANGFKTVHQNGVVLEVDQEARLDFTLEIGNAREVVTVEGSAPLLNNSDSTVSTVVDGHFVDNLPLNGRSFQTLIMLTPGVVVTATAFDDQGQFSVNGQRGDANYFTVDGVSANFGVTGYFPLVQASGGALPALSVSGGTNSLVSVDAMQEFRSRTWAHARRPDLDCDALRHKQFSRHAV
jgi:Carboxypeptidase regulatory-like domain